MVESGIEHPFLCFRTLDVDLGDILIPSTPQESQLGVKVMVWDIPSRLLGADIRDADLHLTRCQTLCEVQSHRVSDTL